MPGTDFFRSGCVCLETKDGYRPFMPIARSILSVLAGYFIFAVSSFALFRISGVPPHESAPLGFKIGSAVFGAGFAFLGGYVAALLARRAPVVHGIAVALVVAVGATVSLISTIGKGAVWSQVAALLVMAPSAAFGGMQRARRLSAHAGSNIAEPGESPGSRE